MANGNGNASYNELVNMLRWIFTEKVEAKFRFTRGLLGDGNGNVDVPDRDGFSYVRPDRSSNKIIELFNKTVDAADETPILIGEIPWQPGIQQVLGIDWESYLKIGWDARFAGLAKHGAEHEWPDTTPGSDTFTVYRRMLFPLRTEAAGGLNVVINPYAMTVTGSNRAWPGSPLFDLTSLVPSTAGNQRFASLFWDYSTNLPHGQIGALTGTLSAISDTSLPVQPTSFPPKSIPSSFVLLQNGDTEITDERVYDAREILSPFNPVTMDDVEGAWKLGNTIVVSSSGNGDYEDIASAIAAASSGDTILVDTGTYTCNNQTLPAGTTIQGMSPDGTKLTSSSSAVTLIVGAGSIVKNLEVENTSSSATAEALKITGNNAKIYNVLASTDGSPTTGYAISIVGASTVRLYECEGLGNGSSSDAGLYIDGTASVTVFGGRYDSTNGSDVIEDTGTNIINFSNPVLVNGSTSGTGFSGIYLDGDDNLISPTGYVGIGDTNPSGMFRVNETYSDGAARTLAQFDQDWTPTGTSGSVFPTAVGIFPAYNSSHTPSGGFLTAFRLFGDIDGGGDFGLRLVDLRGANLDTSTVATMNIIQVRAAVNSGGGAITTFKAINIENSTAATTNYGIDQAGTGMINRFAGSLTVGSQVNPNATLDVRGDAIFNEGGADYDFRIESDTKTHAFFLQGSDGFIGINDSTPGVPLDVAGTGAVARFGDGTGNAQIIFNGAVASARDMIYQTAGSNRWIFRVGNQPESGSNAGSDFEVVARTDAGASLATRMYIRRSDGQVGIGTTGPNALLDVRGSAIFNENSASVDFRIESNTKTHMFFVDGSADVIGINTSSPSSSYEVDVSGDHHATNHFDTSDRYFKRNIKVLPNGTLDKVLLLNPVTFQWGWKHAKGMGRSKVNSRSVGFIAQDVKKIFPEVVSSWQEKGKGRTYHGLAYNRLVTHLTKAIQELNSKVEDLQAQVDALTP